MCKLAGWSASSKYAVTKAEASAAINRVADIMYKTEKDGFGFAQPKDGLIGRYVDPTHFRGIDALPQLKELSGKGYPAFAVSKSADQSGLYAPSRHTMIHGRTATCGVSLKNTHPFRRNGWTLAHNGVISWEGEKSADREAVTCDSEHLLISLYENTGDEAAQKDSMLQISGYAAFIAFAPSGSMIVARDSTASLYAGVTGDGNWIFGTTAQIVEAIAESWKIKGLVAHRLDDWAWLTFESGGGDPIVSTWHHANASSSQWSYAGRSLGSTYGGYPYGHKYQSELLPEPEPEIADAIPGARQESLFPEPTEIEYDELDDLKVSEEDMAEYDELRSEGLTHTEALSCILPDKFASDYGVPAYTPKSK